jgi:hypothetical protein
MCADCLVASTFSLRGASGRAAGCPRVLECDVGDAIAPVPSVAGLHPLNMDPGAAAAAYRERVVGPSASPGRRDAKRQSRSASSGGFRSGLTCTDIHGTTRFLRPRRRAGEPCEGSVCYSRCYWRETPRKLAPLQCYASPRGYLILTASCSASATSRIR